MRISFPCAEHAYLEVSTRTSWSLGFSRWGYAAVVSAPSKTIILSRASKEGPREISHANEIHTMVLHMVAVLETRGSVRHTDARDR